MTVLNATAGMQCTVTGGNGNMPAANVSAFSISCVSATTPTPTSTAHPIPTLGQWAMLLLTGLLVTSAGLFARPRMKTISSSI